MTRLSLLALLIFSSACGQNSGNKITVSSIFFENSKRDIVFQKDKKAMGIAKLNGCTGFFIKNSENKNLIGTARHCFNYDAPTWCNAKSEVTDYYNSKRLKCVGIVAGDSYHDTIIFEFESSVRDRTFDFELADLNLTPGIKLAMLGFPGDEFNPNRDLMQTQNCWVQNPEATSIYSHIPQVKNDEVFTHNCSTYGGNSGGPMFIEGTRIAIGLPDVYTHDITNIPRTYSAQGIRLDGFIEDFRNEIESYGIVLKTSYSSSSRDLDFFSDNIFVSQTASSCKARVSEVIYNTGKYPLRFKLNFQGTNCSPEETFDCKQTGECVAESSQFVVKIHNPQSFYYYNLGSIEYKTFYKVL